MLTRLKFLNLVLFMYILYNNFEFVLAVKNIREWTG